MPAWTAVVAKLVAAGATTGQAWAIVVTAAALKTVAYVAIAYGINRLLTKKPSSPSFDGSGLQNTQTIRESAAPRQIIYGEVRTGGVLVFAQTSGVKNEYLNLVIALASHEVEAIGDIYFNDEVIPLSGNAATGTYAGYASIYKHLGSSTQTVDTNLQAAVGSGTWSNDHRLRGIAYIYVQLKFDADKWPGGIPAISAIVQGRKVLDTRTSTTAYSTNWALCVRDYLTLAGVGLGAAAGEIDISECNAAANISDENVTLNPSGTEKRYAVNGVIDTSQTPGEVLLKMTSAGAGLVLYVGGKWVIRAGAYQTPTITFDENDFRGGISIRTKTSLREIFNGVKGLYVSADNQYQPTDFPAVSDATYVSEDGEEIWRDIELPFTTSNATAQRLAKIELLRGRQQYLVTAPMKLTAIQCQVGDVIQLTNARFGWSAKPFEVVEFSFAIEESGDAPALGVDLVLRETASSVWSWASGEETQVDPAPDTTLFDPLSTETLTGLSLSTQNFIQADGTVSPRIQASWTLPGSQYILAGGYVHLEYKKSADSTWIVWSASIRGDANLDYITDVEAGVSYDVRARFENVNQVKGAYGTQTGFTVSTDTTAPATPSSVVLTSTLESLTLDWADNSEDDLAFYEIYRNTSNNSGSATKIAQALASRFVDTLPSGTTTYYYWIKAVDRTGNASGFSSVVSGSATQQSGGGGTYSLTINWHPSGLGGGYINGTSYSGTSTTVTGLSAGAYATIEAAANVSGDTFSAWSGSAFDVGQLESSTSTNPNRVLMGGNITLTADYI